MTYAQHLSGALERAKHCQLRKKNASAHFREAIGSNALLMVKELQAQGHHFRKDKVIDVLRRMAGRG